MHNNISSGQNGWITLGRFKLAGQNGKHASNSQGIESQVQQAVGDLNLNQAFFSSLVSSLQGAARGIELRSVSHPALETATARIMVSQQSMDLCRTITTQLHQDATLGMAFDEMKLAGSQGWGFFIIEHFGAVGDLEREPPEVWVDLYLYLEEGD